MFWYTGVYGSWNDANGISRISGTYSGKEMFSKAQKIADEKNVIVMVCAEKGTKLFFYEVCPGMATRGKERT